MLGAADARDVERGGREPVGDGGEPVAVANGEAADVVLVGGVVEAVGAQPAWAICALGGLADRPTTTVPR